MKYLISLTFAFILFGCTTTPVRLTAIDGKTLVQKDRKFFNIPVWTFEEEIKTKEQKLEDLKIKGAERKQDNKFKSQERQKAAAYWIGLSLLIGFPVCVFIGYISQGWKFWGTAGAISAILGMSFWSFENLVPFLKWPAYGLCIAIILWTMWKLKDFSLLDKLKKSESGKLI